MMPWSVSLLRVSSSYSHRFSHHPKQRREMPHLSFFELCAQHLWCAGPAHESPSTEQAPEWWLSSVITDPPCATEATPQGWRGHCHLSYLLGYSSTVPCHQPFQPLTLWPQCPSSPHAGLACTQRRRSRIPKATAFRKLFKWHYYLLNLCCNGCTISQQEDLVGLAFERCR